MSEPTTTPASRDDDINEVLRRWFRRMQRSHSFFAQGLFADEEFEALVAALVTGTVVEALLWLGIQFVGYHAPGGPKTLPLGTLVREASKRGLIDPTLCNVLNLFAAVRNGFAHDPDYQLNDAKIAEIHNLLPEPNRQLLAKALGNIYGGDKRHITAVLVYESVAGLTFGAVERAVLKAQQETPQ